MYAGTSIWISSETKRLGGRIGTYANEEDLVETLAEMGSTRLVWLESPTNPTLKVIDIQAIAHATHAAGALLVVDNTFLSGACQKPLSFGADIVLHSATKYLNGHSDVVLGALLTHDASLHERLLDTQVNGGATPSPFDCFLAVRGIRTLALRMRTHCENALGVARFLESHPAIAEVRYPGLPSHPQHELAARQTSGFGGIVAFYMRGGEASVRTLLASLRIIAPAVSLGAVESIIEHPATMTHSRLPEHVRNAVGITDAFVRLSVGIEHVDDIIEDLRQALEKVDNEGVCSESRVNGT